MYCQNCGKDNQTINSYCRNCGIFLPDFEKLSRKETPPELHLTINTTFAFLSGVISLLLAIFLYAFYVGRESTPIIIYVILGFLTANFFWQAQAFWRSYQIKKHLPKRQNRDISQGENSIASFETDKLLPEADKESFVPVSVLEKTTDLLKQKR